MTPNAIDWNKEWKSMMTKSMGEDLPDCAQYWNTAESARRYLRDYGRESAGHIDRVSATLEALSLTPDLRVLEIGTGPGVLAVPIASQTAHVTAVEPSDGMMTVLREYMNEEGVENVRCVQKRWEEVTDDDLEPPYDLVLASFSLGMPEIKAAIEKMNAVSSGRVCLFWHAGEQQFETLYRLVMPHLRGTDYVPGPKADVLFNILYSMEIYPDVRHFNYEQVHVFDSEEEMAEYFQYEHQIPFDIGNPGLKTYLEEFVEEEDGRFVHYEEYQSMMFQWEAQ
ncbi:class I SAM-dependent methyltransferase [Methanofollis aquaemaris]|uniref:Class I SAM-dependent methyltransferase n=1 Tax=Methanofollis aquaemaris TaxID=126734 RepID=A0A8A3S847_9EURY|nr:class I SAM-dependent methyltransferase [Methanofollis aquaemaris]QSZ68212.1 class I SAM-dependent methyltransferase [Methanofollis aquaemaris]